MYEYIIFDVDGTLIDTREATIMALKKLLKEETGKNFKFKELEFVIGIPGEVSLPRLGIEDIDAANRKWSAYLRHYSNCIRVYPGISEMFALLRDAGIKTGLVTSNTKYELKGLLEYFMPFKLTDYAHRIVCADDTERHKPHPDPILKYLELSGADASQAIYIGDTLYDMECARAAGVDFGLALWGTNSTDGMVPEFVFDNPGEILGIIDYPVKLKNSCKSMNMKG